jgi:hypothetical protein
MMMRAWEISKQKQKIESNLLLWHLPQTKATDREEIRWKVA